MKNSIHIISEALKNYISEASSILDSDINLTLPKKEWVDSPSTKNPKVNIYLFEIKENLELRENEWQTIHSVNGSVQKKKPDVRIDLFYIMTFYGQTPESPDAVIGAVEEEQRYLSEVLSIVYNHDYIPQEFFIDNEGNPILNVPDIPISVTRPKFLEGEGGVQLWSAIDQYVKPAIYLKVTAPILFDFQDETSIVLKKNITIHDRHHVPNIVDLKGEVFTKFIKTYSDNSTEEFIMLIPQAKVILEQENVNGNFEIVSSLLTDNRGFFIFKLLDKNKVYQIRVLMRAYSEAVEIIDISKKIEIELIKN